MKRFFIVAAAMLALTGNGQVAMRALEDLDNTNLVCVTDYGPQIASLTARTDATNDLFAAWFSSLHNSTSSWSTAYLWGDWSAAVGSNTAAISALAAGFSDHASLSNLTWTASGHSGTPARLAGFFEGGMAGYAGFGLGMYLDGDDNIAVSNGIISGAALGTTAVQPADTNGWETGTHALLEPKLPDTPTNPATMYLDGNRVWSPIRIGAGGYAGNLYFRTDASTNAGYSRLDYMAETTESNLTATINSGEFLLRSYVFDSPLGTDSIDAGMWVASFFAAVDKTAGVSQLKFEAFVMETNGTETVLFSAYSHEIDNDVPEFLKKETTQPSFAVSPLGRLGAKIYAKATVPSVTFTTVVGDGNGSFFTTPLRIRHTQLRDLDGDPLYQHVTETERARIGLALTNEVDPEWTSKSNSYATVANLSSHTGNAAIHLSEAQAEKIAAAITSAPPQTVVSVNGSTGAVVITAVSLGALTNEADAIALAALAAHAAYWPPNATASSWFTFTTNAGAITITGYDIGGGTDVVIPDYINGFPVKVIGVGAFYGLAITSFSGGATVLTFGDAVFFACTSLSYISMPNAQTFGDAVFIGCTSLVSVLIPSAQTLGGSVFSDCTSLVSILLPSVQTFAGSIFANCTTLNSVFWGTDQPTDDAYTFENLPANQVTNYVTNPQATGWGATFGGMPVVRLPLYGSSVTAQAYTLNGDTITEWPAGGGGATNITDGVTSGTYSEATRTLNISNLLAGVSMELPDGIVTNGMNSPVTLGKTFSYASDRVGIQTTADNGVDILQVNGQAVLGSYVLVTTDTTGANTTRKKYNNIPLALEIQFGDASDLYAYPMAFFNNNPAGGDYIFTSFTVNIGAAYAGDVMIENPKGGIVNYCNGDQRCTVGTSWTATPVWTAKKATQNMLVGTKTDNGTDKLQVNGAVKATSIKAIHKTSNGTSAVADGTYTVGIGTTQNGTITITDGIITAIQQAQ